MADTPIRRILRPLWRALPLAAKSRLIGLFRRATDPRQADITGMSEAEKFRVGVPTVPGLIENIRRNGFSPFTIVDVGANVGDWSRTASAIFPSARMLMFDGDPDNEAALLNAVHEIGSRAAYFLKLLGPEKKDAVAFYKHEPSVGTTGSSILPELTSFETEAVALPMDTLDSAIDGVAAQPPLLLKLDVQGFELEILKGGRRTLRLAEVVIMEASLLPYNEGAPLFADVVAFMNEAGFVVFDFCGQLRRESDYSLFQTDVAFVRRESNLRAPRKFWLSEP
jgi:FkbM family methyltransferase